MLTATLSPLEESYLLLEYGVQWPHVIRESTNRQNLRYCKVAVNTSAATIQRIQDAATGVGILEVCDKATAFFTIKLILERLESLAESSSEDCVIVYFNTIKRLKAFHQMLEICANGIEFADYFVETDITIDENATAVQTLLLKWYSVFGVYHSEINPADAHTTLKAFRDNSTRVLLATSAFGKHIIISVR